jgi:outer membrane lipoprotein-sorting protein
MLHHHESMLIGAVTLAAALSLSPRTLVNGGALTAGDILAAADRGRNGWDSFTVETVITNYKGDRVDDVSTYTVYVKGADHSLVKFEDPRDRGKYLLTDDEAMWFYLPSASRPIRVTPLQRLSGNASNGDIAQMAFAANYDATLTDDTSVGGNAAYVLDLTARRRSATYQRVRYVVAKASLLPIEAEFMVASGKTTKQARFEEYGESGGRRVLRREVLGDLLRKDVRTVLEFRRYSPQDLPDKLFNKNFLREF